MDWTDKDKWLQGAFTKIDILKHEPHWQKWLEIFQNIYRKYRDRSMCDFDTVFRRLYEWGGASFDMICPDMTDTQIFVLNILPSPP